MDKDRLFTGSNDQTVRSCNIKVIEVERVLAQENLPKTHPQKIT